MTKNSVNRLSLAVKRTNTYGTYVLASQVTTRFDIVILVKSFRRVRVVNYKVAETS